MVLVKSLLQTGRCLVIGEVAQAHDGSLGTAHAFIDAIARAGADAVKFQTHLAAAESTPQEPWRVKFSRQDATRYDYWKRMEFTEEQWHGLQQHATEAGLLFLSSPFSVEAVELLRRVGVAGWKIASGEVTNHSLFDLIAETQLPVLLSTGMCTWEEIDEAVTRIRSSDLPLAIMQCTSAYPCPPERVGLNVLGELRNRYSCAVGLSDHSGCIYPGLAAATLGIEVLEVHVTLSRDMFGPDVPASLTTAEVKQLVDGIRYIERMKAHPVDKNTEAGMLADIRHVFSKSVVARQDLPQGTVLQRQHLALKKPGTGIPPRRLEELLNRRLRRTITADTQIREDDLDS